VGGELVGIEVDEGLGEHVVEHRERHPVGHAQAGDVQHGAADLDAERLCDPVVGLAAGRRQHARGRRLALPREVLVQARQLDVAGDPAVHDLRADAAAAHEQALVDEVLDRAADGGPGEPEPVAERDLVLETCARGQRAVVDRRLQQVGDLVVEGHGA
jgi:hypothetical protein